MRKRITVGGIMIGIIGVAYLFSLGVNVADFLTQLAVAIVLVLLGLGYWGFKPEIHRLLKIKGKQSLEQKPSLEMRIAHTRLLSNEIYRRLLDIDVREEPLKLVFKIPADYDNFHNVSDDERMRRIAQGINAVNLIPISMLNTTSYTWAFEHLKQKYRDIHVHWTEAELLRQKYDELLGTIKSSLDDYVCSKMKEEFPTFVERNDSSDNENQYYLRWISDILYKSLCSYAVDNMRSDFIYLTKGHREDNRWLIQMNGFILISSPNKEEADEGKMRKILIAVYDDSALVQKCKDLHTLGVQTRDAINQFCDKLQRLVDEAERDQPIEGKCSLGY